MQSKERQKMCPSCDGRIPVEAEHCPYCGAGQQSFFNADPSLFERNQSLEDNLTALYQPPYRTGKIEEARAKTALPSSAGYSPLQQEKPEPPREIMQEKKYQQTSPVLGIPTIPVDASEEQQAQADKSSFWPILFLSVAANLLVIGILQLFFSDEGVLRLEWSSQYWFVYCLAAIPLFFLGLKKANTL